MRTLSSSTRIVLGGDLNQLAPEMIFEMTDLISAVSAPTRGESHLDHLLVSNTFYSHIKIVRPVLRSDHMAIVAYTGEVKINRLKQKRVCMYRKRSPNQHATFLADLSRLGPSHFSLPKTDIQNPADVFYDRALLDRHYPERQIICHLTPTTSRHT